ncbi:MAG: hypothetical protein AB1327_01125 [Bacillota bacterium]|uniref:helix-turn-helix domain-containing protein n=1 Tax=Desulforudis sp. DRI-14 TaxID=3459793 RepID=UPI003479CD71
MPSNLLMDNPLAFSLTYIGAILLLFLGLAWLGWVLIRRRGQRRRQFEGELAAAVEEQVDLNERLDKIAAELAAFRAALDGVKDGLAKVEVQLESLSVVGIPYNGTVPSLAEDVARAYEKGKSIEDLARELGRGQGEIELMLKMHKMRLKGGCMF